ncbi:MAG: DEAD/DEAH box helicase [Phycisphaerales bacterium]|nr:DEAD/DEAH box helicase [Phycisphaerales bacterium]
MTHTEQAPSPTDETSTTPGPLDSEESGATTPTADGEAPKKKRRRRRRRSKSGGGGEDGPADAQGEADGGEDVDHDAEPVVFAPAAEPAPGAKTSDIFSTQDFASLGLRNSVLKGVAACGFSSPTKIQADLIPAVLSNRDVLGQAKTGSGKTAAFGLPLFHMATRELAFQTIIMVPTRELAVQVANEMADLGKFTPIRVSAVMGGESIRGQARELERGPEIIVATPGRLIDMLDRGLMHLNNVKFVVLDEVDRMLDIGFRDDIRRILSRIRSEHRTIFVSATISEEIERLARSFMRDPVKIVAHAGSLTVSLVEQRYLPVQPWDKRRLLLHLLTHEEPALTIVFCRTKRGVDDVAEHLHRHGIDVQAIHGDMRQGKRNQVMKMMHAGSLSVLVASDLAARGIDVEGITHVINYDLPEDPEVYVHRIGRTARAGRHGIAWSFVTPEQGPLLTAVEKLANIEIPRLEYPDFEPSPPREGRDGGRGRGGPRPQSDAPAEPPKPPARTLAAAPPKPAAAVDASRFPGGLVPTKLPPRTLGGRVKTSRSARSAPKPEE